MNVLINHCWCHDCNWGGQYNCRVIVSVEHFATLDDIHKRKSTLDWSMIVEDVPYDNGKEIPFRKLETTRLKPEVMQWLNNNVKERDCDEQKQGWAVGSDEYNSTDRLGFSIFFERPTDALNFIKRWSVYKKPVDYLNYFRDVRKKLDPKTNTLRRVPRWND